MRACVEKVKMFIKPIFTGKKFKEQQTNKKQQKEKQNNGINAI